MHIPDLNGSNGADKIEQKKKSHNRMEYIHMCGHECFVFEIVVSQPESVISAACTYTYIGMHVYIIYSIHKYANVINNSTVCLRCHCVTMKMAHVYQHRQCLLHFADDSKVTEFIFIIIIHSSE